VGRGDGASDSGNYAMKSAQLSEDGNGSGGGGGDSSDQ